MTDVAEAGGSKPATAARIYDYHLGGTHNFPADREAGAMVATMFPLVSVIAKTNRAFLQRAVRYAASQGIRQYLDLGAGIPTQGNVHEVADAVIDDAHVVYVDVDPVAVSEGLDILQGNERSIAVWGDVRDPQPILDNPQIKALIDFDQPVALMLVGVLHFVPDDVAYGAVQRFVEVLAPGSLLIISHAAADAQEFDQSNVDTMKDIYRQRTATPLHLRTRDGVVRFFDGLELVDPGLTWIPLWRPESTDPQDLVGTPQLSAGHVAVGRVP